MMKKIKHILIMVIALSLSITCTSCDFYTEFMAEREKRRQELFNRINQIEKSPEYAIVYNNGYVTSTNEIDFKALILEKIKEDGKKVESTSVSIYHLKEEIMHFYINYREENRVLGLNNKNNNYAVGVLSLADYSISIQYFKCKYEKVTSITLTQTHHVFSFEDKDKEIEEGKFEPGYMTIDRKNGDVKEYKNADEALNNSGKEIPIYYSPDIYIEKGVEYSVGHSSFRKVEETSGGFVMVPDASYIEERSNKMKIIMEILREKGDDDISGFFFTNGQDLFIGFVASHGMFGTTSHLNFPIIFKCDTSLESFEYIGCVYYSYSEYYRNLDVRRIQN